MYIYFFFADFQAPFFELDTPKSDTAVEDDHLATDLDCEDASSVESFSLDSPRRISPRRILPAPIIPGTTDDNASPGLPLDCLVSSPKMARPTTTGLVSDLDEENSRDSGVCMDSESRSQSRDKQLVSTRNTNFKSFIGKS